MIWFTADTHFFHENILKHQNRPWATVEEMNEGLLRRINETVGLNDALYVLGDFSFKAKQVGRPCRMICAALTSRQKGK